MKKGMLLALIILLPGCACWQGPCGSKKKVVNLDAQERSMPSDIEFIPMDQTPMGDVESAESVDQMVRHYFDQDSSEFVLDAENDEMYS